MAVGREAFALIHEALKTRHPGLRFHLKAGRMTRNVHYDNVVRSVIVEYDPEGLEHQRGSVKELRTIVKDVVGSTQWRDTLTGVRFEAVLPVARQKELAELAKQAEAKATLEELRTLMDEGATETTLIQALMRYKKHPTANV